MKTKVLTFWLFVVPIALICLLFTNKALASNDIYFLQPAAQVGEITYDEDLIVNATGKFDSLYVGKQGEGGVTFFNGTIVNSTTGDQGEDNPVTFGDSVRIDGSLFRGAAIGSGDDMPVKIADDLYLEGVITGNGSVIINDELMVNKALIVSGALNGTVGNFSGNVKVGNLLGTGVVSSDNITDGSVDISTDTNLSAGQGLSLNDDTLNINDIYLSNTGDSATGTYNFNDSLVLGSNSSDTLVVNASLQGRSALVFEGKTENDNESTFIITEPTADRNITFQDASGTVAYLSDIPSVSNLWGAGSYGTYEDGAGVIVGIDQAETLSNTNFELSTGDLFVQDQIGAEGNIYTDGTLNVSTTTVLSDGKLETTSGNLTLETTGGSSLIINQDTAASNVQINSNWNTSGSQLQLTGDLYLSSADNQYMMGINSSVISSLDAGVNKGGMLIDIDGNASDNTTSFVDGLKVTSADASGGTMTALRVDGTFWDQGLYIEGASGYGIYVDSGISKFDDIILSTPTDSPTTCSSSLKGGMYYDDSMNEPCFCNGTAWHQFDGEGPCT